MLTPLSINQGVNTHQFHAFLRDEQEMVKTAFNRRIKITKPDDDLIIKLIEDLPDRAVYEISRRNVRKDMDSDECYRLTLLASMEIKSDESGNVILVKPEKYSWFAEAGQIFINEKGCPEKRVGTLMMVNPEAVKLLEKESSEPASVKREASTQQRDDKIHQLLEMLPATAREPHILEKTTFAGVPKLASNLFDPLLSQWPVLEDAGMCYRHKKDRLPTSLRGIVSEMSSQAKTIAAFHREGIAHGDIKLSGMRVIDGKVGPGNLERFSIVGQKSGPDKLGEKRFIFYNNAFHAPELRFPGTFGNTDAVFKSWQYTSITKEGDVWSLGMLLAVMLCRIPGGRERLEETGVLQSSLSEYMKTSGKYDSKTLDQAIADENGEIARKGGKGTRYLSNPKNLLELNLPKENGLPLQSATSIPAEDKEKLSQLVTLVAECTHHNPEQRPSAEKLQEALGRIVP